MSKLTHNQENFAQGVASGLNQTDAYRKAYKAGNMSDKTVWEKASRLAAKDTVRARVNGLRAELAEKQLRSREQSVKALIHAYKTADQQGQANAMTGAVKELNAMHGFDAPQQIEISGPGGGPVKTISQEMTPEEAAAAYAATVTDTRQD